MKFEANYHVYRCKPEVLGNEFSEDPFFVNLRGISQDDFDKQVAIEVGIKMEHSPDEALKLTSKGAADFIADRVEGFENLFAGDKEIKTFDDCREHAPREITTWIMHAIYSTTVLTESEVKN